MTLKLLALALMAAFGTAPAHATERSAATVAQFRKATPCPATGKIQRTCPGFVVDHMIPLCAGGPDSVENMTFQPIAESYRKDSRERELCRRLKSCATNKPATQTVDSVKQ